MNNLAQSGLIDPHLVNAARAVPHQVGLVKLSKTQLKILTAIEDGEMVTARQVAERCKLSPSWVSTNLRCLSGKCYLQRTDKAQLNGGIEFHYLKLGA
ncbi:ArsR family transcriptional regulator [Photobacterium nomapromontoriensis]|uniref:ArsR family transcriptional regulator n=1 Tax=Photobacterium nomapromontoriensis TaxID=2910237 RepID=UPI003D138580